MSTLDSFGLVAFSTIFSIVNPLGALGPFLAMTAVDSRTRRRQTALRASLTSFVILTVCTALGAFIFRFFGITLPALKIAGGVLLFLVAMDMLNARPSRSKSTQEEADEGAEKEDIAIFPLAIPLLSGPGAIVSVFILAERAETGWQHASIYGSVAVTMLVVFLILREGDRLMNVMGTIGINVMSRLMGLILAAMAVQFIIDGVTTALPGLGPAMSGILPPVA